MQVWQRRDGPPVKGFLVRSAPVCLSLSLPARCVLASLPVVWRRCVTEPHVWEVERESRRRSKCPLDGAPPAIRHSDRLQAGGRAGRHCSALSSSQRANPPTRSHAHQRTHALKSSRYYLTNPNASNPDFKPLHPIFNFLRLPLHPTLSHHPSAIIPEKDRHPSSVYSFARFLFSSLSPFFLLVARRAVRPELLSAHRTSPRQPDLLRARVPRS